MIGKIPVQAMQSLDEDIVFTPSNHVGYEEVQELIKIAYLEGQRYVLEDYEHERNSVIEIDQLIKEIKDYL